MKIWHLVHQYLPEKIGGTELYTRDVAHEQAQLGHAVTILAPSMLTDGNPNAPAAAGEPDVRRYPTGPRSPLQVFLANTRSDEQFLAWFAEGLRADPPDIVHVEHLMGIPLGVINLLQEHSIPYVITLHDYWFVCPNAQLLTNTDQTVCEGPDAHFANCGRCLLARAGLPAPRLGGLLTGKVVAGRARRLGPILAGARRLIAPTHFVRERFLQAGLLDDSEKIVVLPHGLAIPEQLPPRRDPAEEPFRVVYLGGLSSQKGIHILIEAFNHLPTGAECIIYGDEDAFPDYVARLRKKAAHGGIKFGGRLPHDKIWPILRQASLVAVPTLWYETYSFIVDEALAASTPVMASDIGIMPEKIRPGVDGVLVPVGDVAKWAAELSRFYHNRDQLRVLAKTSNRGLTPTEHVAQLLEIYREI